MLEFDHAFDLDLTLCVVGNLLGRNAGYVTTQGQILSDRLTNDGHTVISTSSRVSRLARLAEIILTLIRNRRRIDIVILEVYSGPYFIIADVASLLARSFGIPMIFVLHGGNLPNFSDRFGGWVRRVFRRADILVAPSRFLANGLAGLGSSIRVVPNIVEVENYNFRPRSAIQPILLWMRAFHEIYNPRMAIETLDLIKRSFPDARLTMAGVDKGLESEIRRLAEDLGLRNAVRFPGFLGPDEKSREFSEADIFLNTNKIDNMPVALIEARAMGVPIVATNVGGVPDMIVNGEDGLLVPDGDVQAMANAVISLLKNAELAERISKNGRELAERSSWNEVRAEWVKIFDEVTQIKVRTSQPIRDQKVSNS